MKEFSLNHIGVKDPRARESVIERMLSAPEEVYIGALEAGIRSHDDRELRDASMHAYRKLGRKSLDSLLGLLADRMDWEARMFAATILGDIEDGGDGRVLQGLIDAIKDPEENVRIAAIEAIGKIGHTGALAALSEAVGDAQWVSIAALDAMARIGGPDAFEMLCSNLESHANPGVIINVLAKINDLRAVRVLSPFLSRDDGAMRELALKSIVKICLQTGHRFSPEFFYPEVPFLAELSGSVRKETARCALIALSWSGDSRGVEIFLNTLGDEELREYAVSGLITVGRKGVPAIVDFMKAKTGENRRLCAVILSAIGEYEALAQFTSDKEPGVRAEAADALKYVDSRRAGKLLAELARDPDEEVRSAALESIQAREKTEAGLFRD